MFIADPPGKIILIKSCSEFLGLVFFIFALIAAKQRNFPYNSNDNFAENLVMATIIMVSMQHSGALFNPVVNVNFLLRKKIGPLECVIYTIVQIVAVFVAGIVANYLLDLVIQPSFDVDRPGDIYKLFLNEMIFTFLLLLFINIQITPETAFTEQAIFTGLVFMIVLQTVRIESIDSGSVLNPAIGISLPLVAQILVPSYDSVHLIWLWVFAPLLGGILAWAFFMYLYFPQAKRLKGI